MTGIKSVFRSASPSAPRAWFSPVTMDLRLTGPHHRANPAPLARSSRARPSNHAHPAQPRHRSHAALVPRSQAGSGYRLSRCVMPRRHTALWLSAFLTYYVVAGGRNRRTALNALAISRSGTPLAESLLKSNRGQPRQEEHADAVRGRARRTTCPHLPAQPGALPSGAQGPPGMRCGARARRYGLRRSMGSGTARKNPWA